MCVRNYSPSCSQTESPLDSYSISGLPHTPTPVPTPHPTTTPRLLPRPRPPRTPVPTPSPTSPRPGLPTPRLRPRHQPPHTPTLGSTYHRRLNPLRSVLTSDDWGTEVGTLRTESPDTLLQTHTPLNNVVVILQLRNIDKWRSGNFSLGQHSRKTHGI